jgi:hypothetical protein
MKIRTYVCFLRELRYSVPNEKYKTLVCFLHAPTGRRGTNFMPRPESVTDADVARWHTFIDSFFKSEAPPEPVLAVALSRGLDCFYAGCWLVERLSEAGAPSAQAGTVKRFYSQNSLRHPDPWAAAEELLKGYLADRKRIEEASAAIRSLPKPSNLRQVSSVQGRMRRVAVDRRTGGSSCMN